MVDSSISIHQKNILTAVLEEKGYLPGKNLSEKSLAEIPEYNVLTGILASPQQAATADELEHLTSSPLAMILSNLSADGIIYQSPSNYRWMLSKEIQQRLEETPSDKDLQKEIKTKKEEKEMQGLEVLQTALAGTMYVQEGHLATSLPEVEILLLLAAHKNMQTEEIEKKASSTGITLAVSNLQADGYIIQNPDYSWSLSPDLVAKMQTIQSDLDTEEKEEIQVMEERANIAPKEIITVDSPEYRYLIEAMKSTQYIRGQDESANLLDIPEFEILTLLYREEALTLTEIKEKSMNKAGLSLALSNLNADQLILNVKDQWKLDPMFLQRINKIRNKLREETVRTMEKKQEQEEISKLEEKNKLLVKIIGYLRSVNLSYVNSNTTVKNARGIPELELIHALFEKEKMSTEELESHVQVGSSLSLVLSNLQADGIVAQDLNYNWYVKEEVRQAIDRYTPKNLDVPKHQYTEESTLVHTTEALRQKEILSEKLKLRKLFHEIGLISSPDIPLKDLMQKTEFEILSIIVQNQAVETSEIEAALSKPVLISMELSNLAADDLIYYEEVESKWRISTKLQSMMRKIKLDETEIAQELEQKPVETPSVARVEKTETVSSPTISELDKAIIDLLQSRGYPVTDKMSVQQLINVGEFEILKLVAKHEPVTINELEQILQGNTSLTLSLSNLRADGLVTEESYKYSLPPEISSKLKGLEDSATHHSNPKNNSAEKAEIEASESDKEVEPSDSNSEIKEMVEQRRAEEADRRRLLPFMKTVLQYGYLDAIDLPHSALLSVTEYEVLYHIMEKGSVSTQELKNSVSSTSPVLISRVLNKMQADNAIVLTDDGIVSLSSEFNEKMSSQ